MDFWKDISSQTCTKSFSLQFIEAFLLSSDIASSPAWIFQNVHYFDGPIQQTHILIYLLLGDVPQYPIAGYGKNFLSLVRQRTQFSFLVYA